MAERLSSFSDGLRLAGLLAGVALATSRLGLIGHELIGHGGAALALGASIERVQLFWFGGGWIRYDLAEPSMAPALAIAMAGIAVELIVGVALWLVVRGDGLGRRLARGVGAAVITHAAWYLATGVWHGYGDGVLLHRALGDARVLVAVPAGLVACAAAFLGAREVLHAITGTQRRHRVIATICAAVAAAGLQLGLAAGELAIRKDTTYAATMAPERERVIASELARWTASQREPVTQAARAAEQARLETEHRTFPFAWLLGAATVLALIAGGLRAKPGEDLPIEPRLLAYTAILAAAATGLVIAIGAML